MSEDPNRWEDVYRNKKEAETSWHEARPQVSLDLIAETGARRDAAIVEAAEVDGLTLSNLSRFDSVTDRGGYLGTWRKKCN